MSVKGEKWNKLVKLSNNHFLRQTINYGGDMWLRAKTKVILKPELKMKIV